MGQRERVAKGAGKQGLDFLAARQVRIVAVFPCFPYFACNIAISGNQHNEM
jgi:hypothetical protein